MDGCAEEVAGVRGQGKGRGVSGGDDGEVDLQGGSDDLAISRAEPPDAVGCYMLESRP